MNIESYMLTCFLPNTRFNMMERVYSDGVDITSTDIYCDSQDEKSN